MNPDPPLFARLYLDEDVHKRVAAAPRLRHFDIIAASEAARRVLADLEQLVFAASNGRAIFTYNARDFIRLHFDWMKCGKSHFGIIVSDQASLAETLRRLLRFLNRVPADELMNQIYWLQAFK
jgi:hypothetical protein